MYPNKSFTPSSLLTGIGKVITHYKRVFLTITIVTTKFVATIFIPSSLPFTITYIL